MQLIRAGIAVSGALVGMTACGDPITPQNGGVSAFDADQPSYRLESTAEGLTTTIPFTFVNRTGASIFVLNCNRISSVHLEKDIGGAWTFAWGGGTPDCLSPAIEVRVGERFNDTLNVFAGHPDGVVEPKFEVHPPEGRYRLVWNGVFRSVADVTYPYGPEISKDLRVSAPFEIIEP